MSDPRRIVVTGARGFVGQNLMVRLAEAGFTSVVPIGREDDDAALRQAVAGAEVIFHLAGANRPERVEDFYAINRDLSARLVEAIAAAGMRPLVIYTSSAKAGEDSDYGRSKREAEEVLLAGAARTGATIVVERLPNIFGKWARPNYNSGVATFCHNIARGLPITVHDAGAPVTLLYVDDLIDHWLTLLDAPPANGLHPGPTAYATTVGELAATIRGFEEDRADAMIASVGTGLTRALYATYVSYLPPERFAYGLTQHTDPRGSFSEMLKTRTSGQFSYFTAHPGVTRGGHYHHTKTEKFLIVHGRALFRFRHILTDETHEVRTSADTPVVVETIPGWAHDVTNVGDEVMVSLLWANEVFDRARPDTVAARV